MRTPATLTLNNSIFQVAGDLSFNNVMALHEQSLTELNRLPELTFDFSGVTSSDSSGLGLVIEWIKLADLQKKKIRFKNISHHLMSIATASGLDKIIKPLVLTA
jgi:phospholipid transport system transporter-binding protein